MSLTFPKTVRAAKIHDLDQWALGDALLKESTEYDQGKKGLIAVSQELKDNGIEHGVRYLGLLRQVAMTFPSNRRHPGIALRAHYAAGNPDSLDVIAKAARKQGRAVSHTFVEDVLREIRTKARDKASEEREHAKKKEREAEEKERRAANEAEREAARAEKRAAKAQRKAAKSPRRESLPAPHEHDVSALEARARFMRDANEARRMANACLKLVRENLEDYSPAAIAGLTDAALTVANTWNEVASKLAAASKKGGKGLLSVVNE